MGTNRGIPGEGKKIWILRLTHACAIHKWRLPEGMVQASPASGNREKHLSHEAGVVPASCLCVFCGFPRDLWCLLFEIVILMKGHVGGGPGSGSF
jgi:hypothetical protein